MPVASLTEEPTGLALAAKIASGETTAVDAAQAAIARIERLDSGINAVVVRDFDRGLQQAQAADALRLSGQKLPFLGVPMTVKESFNIAGLPTTWGMEEAAHNLATEDSMVVKRLKQAGAVILGKTNVPPMLADTFSENPIYGRTNNPHHLGHSPGGSSGGAAAAVASGIVALEYGSDIGGSIRVPAHYCGIWGHKPTFGVISLEGHFMPGQEEGASRPLSVVGPLSRDADDLELLLNVTLDRPLPKESIQLDNARILLLTDHPSATTGNGLVGHMEQVATLLENAGAQISRSHDDLPDLAQQHRDYLHMLNIVMMAGAPRPDGTAVEARHWFALLDAQARNQRHWRSVFETFDLILAPPSSTPAFAHDNRPMKDRKILVDGQEYPAAMQLAWAGLVTFPGLPATVLPIGMDQGLPIGMQVISDRYQDYKALDGARKIGALLGQ
ncbi:MAG: amidase family protein [Parasphingorhabdus sp.]|uniref:amidase family protein n=1 Tax=Parasphingorhabdus sp. TaxID=2709688 RepID=UPI0032982786